MTGLTWTLGMTRDVPAVTRTTPGGKVILVRPAVTGGETVNFDLRKAPHLLIAGTTGSGKSVAIHGMIRQLIQAHDTSTVGLVLIDPKRVELGEYRGLPWVASPFGPGHVHKRPEESVAALTWLLLQIERRFDVMALYGHRDAAQVAQGVWEGHELGARYLVLVVDELADLVMTTRKTHAEETLARILQLGRAAGVHAVLATQRPSTDVVSGVIKANVPSRLSFALQNAIDSRVALGTRGAEDLEGAGDALWLPAGARTPVRIQGAVAFVIR